jgi:hypothetical protein
MGRAAEKQMCKVLEGCTRMSPWPGTVWPKLCVFLVQGYRGVQECRGERLFSRLLTDSPKGNSLSFATAQDTQGFI